jgi:hypothetical protein
LRAIYVSIIVISNFRNFSDLGADLDGNVVLVGETAEGRLRE